ncbi:hypothetical protein EVAR_53510_1 [Eumeta japonica]|uniref:Uncharacterized protein n=1 Tax=Eumeta variegata TaxID=151549 RepID=A0A4C1Y4M5_EUMVA|nr:hypothetical protein EVAR_53510_1 [Eumeta japonica]
MQTSAIKRKLPAKTRKCGPDVATTRLGGVFAEPRGVETAGTSRTAARVQVYIEHPVVAIKTEYEDEEEVPIKNMGLTYQQQGLNTGILKQEHDFVMEKDEEKFYEVTIKSELDIGPTVLQPETASCPLLPPNKDDPCSDRLQLKLPKQEPDLSNTTPPHVTHKLQPLDRSFMKPFKNAYYLIYGCGRTNAGVRITEYDMASLISGAFETVARCELAKSGLRCSGIHPFDKNVFTDLDYVPSVITSIPLGSNELTNEIESTNVVATDAVLTSNRQLEITQNITLKKVETGARPVLQSVLKQDILWAVDSRITSTIYRSRKVGKTPAQRQKEYRERRKLRQEANSRKVVKTAIQRSKEYCECERLLQEANSRKIIKTPAQRQKEYRERKKLRQGANSRRIPKTPAQYSREYRERQKLRLAAKSTIDNDGTSLNKNIKTAAQRSREYRQRQKYIKNIKRLQSMKFDQVSGDVTTNESTRFVINEEDLKKKKCIGQLDFVGFHCLPSINVNDTETLLSHDAMSVMSSNITDALKADPEQITTDEVAVGDGAGEAAKYSNYHQHANGHLDFFDIFRGNTFGHSCAVCDRLWWEKDLKDTSPMHESILKIILPDYVTGTNIKVCSTCKVALDRQKIPTLSTYNGFSYPAIPSHLPALDIVSQQLISPRIPFTQIRRLRHVKGQDGIYGQIVNVPLLTNTMVHRLPRNIDDDHCLYVHIEKKLIHNTSYVLRLINKENIKKWVTYLVQTPLYMHYNITINEEFFNSDRVGPDINVDDISEHIPIGDNITAQQQTLLWNKDRFLHMASKERNDSISVLFDGHAEELSFPNIFCGQFRKYREEISVTSFMQAASELRRTDRRGADPQHLLYVATKIMRHRVRASVTVALKHIGNSTNIPKKQIQSKISNYINNCIESNLAFLRCIPNSTWYWAECEEDLLAMFRQRGTPTAFMSLSANETGWTDLLKLLYRLKNNGKEISDESLSEMNYIHKAELINQDAVTCAIYFNRLVTCLLHILQYKKRSPLGRYRVVDYFKKIEFQHGGCPHARILLWLDRTPKNLFHGNTEFIQMIDELVSVSASEASESDEHYYNILRAGIERPKLFYKRTPSEKWHIPFNPFVLHHLKSRMDFQIIEDEQACAAYVVEYINRTAKGVGDFRRRLVEMLDENPDLDVAEMMKEVDVDVVRSVEMSVQEAAWYLLREPMAKSTIATAYIPTMRPVERQRMRKTMRELNATDGDCADVWKENWFDKYERRPGALRDVTLAQFVSRYYENKKGEYVKRSVPRVIRYRNYDAAADADDHKREMVLLHYAFRSEENDVLAEKKYRQIYEDNEDLISQRRKELESNSDIEGTVEMYRRSRGGDESGDDELRNKAQTVSKAEPNTDI